MPSADALITVRAIEAIHDPAWSEWKAIYYDSFPESERMTEGYFLGVFQQKAAGNAGNCHVLIMSPDQSSNDVIAMAYYQFEPHAKVVLLWYLATKRGHRDRGYGAAFYRDVLRRAKQDGADAMLFEVEKPEVAAQEGREHRDLALRRIGWYRRQGALLLGGVQYFQSVDAPVPPTEMDLMVDAFVPMTPSEVFERARQIFGDALTRTGSLSLS